MKEYQLLRDFIQKMRIILDISVSFAYFCHIYVIYQL